MPCESSGTRCARPVARRALAGSEDRRRRSGDGGALLERGLAVDVAPDRFIAEALLDALRAGGDDALRGARVLYAAAEGAREALHDGLEEPGAIVERVTIYRSVIDDSDGAEALRQRLGSAVTWISSPSPRRRR